MALTVDFCGERHVVPDVGWLTIGREGDVLVDDNPYLHRRFLQVGCSGGMWWVVNVGDQLAATVADAEGRVQAWLAPGARLPVVFERTVVRFTAGPSCYELDLHLDESVFSEPAAMPDSAGETTVGLMPFTIDQRRLVVALAEPILRSEGRGTSALPSSADAARRLGWTSTKFNRKLDNVCQKLTRVGVRGLHGAPGELASNRRARLVEYAISVRLVTPADLALLDSADLPGQDADPDEEAAVPRSGCEHG
jgi:hypothetical protein